ncbi:hypothetical protein F5B21DRAFT_522626 [Xylaria acuta]|nr:hypothetical protein F5B21DRAFT_522626 [Xylaria acuta]
MPQLIPDSILEADAKSSPSNSIVKRILTEYCKKPTLVYITFWDGDSLAAHRPSPCPQHKFGGVPCKDIDCIVENYETAFAPLFADSSTKEMYESVRTPRPTYTGSSRSLSLCEIRDAEGKPIDYYFLDNFHRTNVRNAREISRVLRSPVNIPRGPDESQDVDWWPNLVVRLSEVCAAMERSGLSIDSDEGMKYRSFAEFFGILANSRIRLQDYLVLINGKEEDKRVLEEYNCFKEGNNPRHDQNLWEAIKSYDVAEKLPSDITSAGIKDFDKRQCIGAKRIEEFMAAWDTIPGLNLPRAFFVRWKTDEEKKEEDNELNERLHPPVRGRLAFGIPATLKEEMRCQPVLGFTRRLNDYNRYLRK